MPLMLLVHFFKYLGRDNSDTQIALGVAVGMLLGLIPCLTLHWFILFALLLMIRMNFLAALISFQFFTLLFWVASPGLETFGYWILTAHESLLPLFARAYHAPVLPYMAFNHGIVMGATFIAFLLFPLSFGISRFLVHRFRDRVHTIWLSTRLQRAYAHYRRMID